MKFAIQNNKGRVGALRRPDAAARRPYHVAAFTLAEVLAAMLFLAIVIPAAVEALHVSSLAGEVAARKGAAARIADRILNESLVTTNWNNGAQNGTVSEGALDFRWTLLQPALAAGCDADADGGGDVPGAGQGLFGEAEHAGQFPEPAACRQL